MTSYNSERRIFDLLRSNLSEEAQAEFEAAIAVFVERYNTTIPENRFVVGGAVEVFVYALLKSVGADVNLYANQSTKGDILLPNDKKLSVKSSFRGVQAIKIINQQGVGVREWSTATVFVVSGVGIVYGTPEMVDDEYIQHTGDGLALKRRGLRQIIEDERNVINIAVPHKPPTEMVGFSHKASTAFARQILFETGATTLLSAFSVFPSDDVG